MHDIQLLLETKSPTPNAKVRATLAADLLQMDAQEAIDLSSWATAAEFVENELALARVLAHKETPNG